MKPKNKIRVRLIYLLRTLLHIFHLFPLKRRKIIFSAYGGTKITCSPYYIYLKLIELHPEDFDVIWICASDDYNLLREKDKIIFPKGVYFLYHLLTAAIIVDNDGFKSYIPFRKNQLYINTWHGGGLFKTAYGGTRSKEEEIYSCRIKEMKREDVKVMLSTSAEWTRVIARYRFGYKGEILEVGYPRNDIFFKEDLSIVSKVRKILNINNGEKIVLYAPTYRGGLLHRYDDKKNENLNVVALTENLSKKFGGKFRFLYRGHHASKGLYVNNGIDATIYSNMQELMYAADVFISDYSSCLWDYSLTGKPCFIYAPDFEDYAVNPGFESDYKEWPFLIAKNNEELEHNIIVFDKEKYCRSVDVYHRQYGSYEKGNASERVVAYIEDFIKLT